MKRRVKKLVSVLMVALMMCGILGGCGKGSEGKGNQKGGTSGSESAGGVQELTFWVSWGTSEMKKLQVIADAFNENQSEYHITLVSSGGIAEIRSKMGTTKQKYYPSLICGGATTAATYATAEYVAPLQDFIDKEGKDWTTGLFDTVRSSYSDSEGNLLGHPIGVSCAGYAVNLNLLKAAGYSLSDVTSFEKIADIAKKAVKNGVCDYGVSFQSGVDLLDMLTIQGVDYVDNDNGWSGDATKSLLLEGKTNAAVKKAMNIFASLYAEEAAYPYGSTGADATAFKGGKLLFWKTTNSTAFVNLGTTAGFEWAFIPSVGVDDNAEFKGSALSEGTGIYICNTGNEREMQGAYEFVKFLVSEENQVYWATSIGYVGYSEQVVDEYRKWATENYPSGNSIIDTLLSSPAELRLPYVVSDLLSANSELFSAVSIDSKGDIDGYIQAASEKIDMGIQVYNLRKEK